ncbi:hypothetical protein TrRE_jg4476, partial [Triparma retinervis]
MPPTHSTHVTTEIVAKYDGFILDQFGCIHNGVSALPGCLDMIRHLCSEGKRLCILSNSSSAPSGTHKRLIDMNFPEDAFMGAVTSGGECAKGLQETFETKDTVKVFFFTWGTGNPKTASFLDLIGSKFQPTTSIEDADICIAHGTDCVMGGSSLGCLRSSCDYTDTTPLLEKLLSHSIPMYSANPDLKAVNANGIIEYMPGVIAAKYEELGGSVTWYGKPGKEHFEACVKLIGLPKEKCCHVGDSLHHDVKGANNSGVDCIWVVKTGIHN